MSLDDLVARIAGLGTHARVVVLAGPGVVAAGPSAVEGLRALALRGGLGVVNTWGAKGLFEWQSPHHLGTAGLQERDFELAGLGEADLILGTGVDPREAPPERWQLAPHTLVAPRRLAELAERWPVPPAEPARPPLYTRLAEIVQPLYTDEKVPLSPARAVADLEAALPDGGVVSADPGRAGFWIARTFPTSHLGTVVVPAVREPGYAAWAAVQSARSGHQAIAVTAAPHGLETDDALAYAAGSGIPFVLCVWGAGSLRSAGDHRARLEDALADSHVRVVEVPIDWSDTDLLVDLAGEIVAWGGVS